MNRAAALLGTVRAFTDEAEATGLAATIAVSGTKYFKDGDLN